MKVDSVLHVIDTINEWAGRLGRWFVLSLVAIVMFEVVSRYVFNAPTIWAWDVNRFSASLLAYLGGGYLIIYGGHVRIDIIQSRFSDRTNLILDIVTFPVFAFSYAVLFWFAVGETMISFKIDEFYPSLWEPPMWPLRSFVAMGALLILIQGAAKFTRDLRGVVTGVMPEVKGGHGT